MNHLRTLLAALLLAAPAAGQTVKVLGYNTSNGQVIASTNVLFTNAIGFASGAAAQTRTNLGLGSTNDVAFNSISFSGSGTSRLTNDSFYFGTNLIFSIEDASFSIPIAFAGDTAAATRTNLGLPLSALTNTSNVTLMRALAGSTNTNEPFIGTFTIRDDNDANRDITVSNGIIMSVGEPY